MIRNGVVVTMDFLFFLKINKVTREQCLRFHPPPGYDPVMLAESFRQTRVNNMRKKLVVFTSENYFCIFEAILFIEKCYFGDLLLRIPK